MRSLLRHRESLVQMAATHENHLQKALDQIHLQLHHVISDIVGLSGWRLPMRFWRASAIRWCSPSCAMAHQGQRKGNR